MTALTVLLVDDNDAVRAVLRHVLQSAGYACSDALDAEQAKQLLSEQPIDILLTAIHLPGLSGLELIKWIRAQRLACEAVIFTAEPQVETAIEALRAGAADYLTQPVSAAALLEALERVGQRMLNRRQEVGVLTTLEGGPQRVAGGEGAHSVAMPLEASPPRQFRLGPVQLDLDRYLIEVNGQPVEATPSELEILHYLFRNPGRVLTPQELVLSVRGYSADQHEAPEIVRPHISNLRRKLVSLAPSADIIQTVRSVGYILRQTDDAAR